MRQEEYIIYGDKSDPETIRAQTVIEYHGVPCKVIGVSEVDKVFSSLYERVGGKPFPQIFYFDPVRSYGNENMEVHIGGLDKLYEWLRQKYDIRHQDWKNIKQDYE